MLTHKISLERLSHCHPDISKVILGAYDDAAEAGLPYTVSQGLRTLDEQKVLYAQGRTAPGKIVTWTMNSRHLTGHAVDLAIIIGGKYIEDREMYEHLSDHILRAADMLDVPVVWGGTFLDEHGKSRPDRPHYELDRKVYHV